MNIISIKDLWIYREDHIVLENINLEIFEGDFLGLIGPNGGGKSTLLMTILGLLKPDRGDVKVLGLEPKAARGSIGYMPQKTSLDKSFPVSALEVVLMGRYSRAGFMRRYQPEDREAAFRALEAVDMEDRAAKEMGTLSGGEQQRILIARAIVSQPKLLLLDEPASGIDATQQTEFNELLSRLNKYTTIVLVSHDLTAVSSYVGKIACLNHKLYYHGAKELSREEIEKAYGCPIEMIAHGMPHRVLRMHD
jgi:zinc transport system ATP-binding protein